MADEANPETRAHPGPDAPLATAVVGGPPDRTSASRIDAVEDRLVTAIAVGEYLPGARLPAERELAALLGAGRMTVRSALARLVDRGLLETVRGRGGGSFVRSQWASSSADVLRRTLSTRWAAIQDTADAISMLHGTIARAAAERRTPADVVVLRERLDGFRSAASGAESQRADSELHRSIIDTAGNETLRTVLLGLESQLSISAPAHLWGEADGMAAMEARALRDHEALVAAIADGRAADAEAVAREHVGIDMELLEQVLRRVER